VNTHPIDLPDGLATLEVTDVDLGQHHESIDVGPFAGTYLRLRATDLVVAVDEARRLLDRIEEAVLDARHDATMAARVPCPSCSTLIDPEEPDCGAPMCRALAGVTV
jgi:hypothetical protein